jgi:hypothetical protein
MYVPLVLTLKTLHSARNFILCFLCISVKTMKFALYSISWQVFMTEETSVYCVVRTGALNKMN